MALAIGLFFTAQPILLSVLFILQIALWLYSRIQFRDFRRLLRRLSLFFLFICISYAFIPLEGQTAQHWWTIPVFEWQIRINQSGLFLALLMCLRVSTLVLASTWVQKTLGPGEFVNALKQFRVPQFLAITIDTTLSLISDGSGSGRGTGKRGGKKKSKRERAAILFSQIRQGQLGFLSDMIQTALNRTEKHIQKENSSLMGHQARDLAIISGLAVTMMGLKMLQILPGLPVAPGHKNLLMIPLFLLASHATTLRFGGLWTGITLGCVSFLMGYGKYGILEIAQFAVPGLLADFLLPFVRGNARWWRLLQFAFVGVIMGIGRFAANFLVIVLAGAPDIAFVIYLPMLFSQAFFGGLSALVSVFLLNPKSQFSGIAKQPHLAKNSDTGA